MVWVGVLLDYRVWIPVGGTALSTQGLIAELISSGLLGSDQVVRSPEVEDEISSDIVASDTSLRALVSKVEGRLISGRRCLVAFESQNHACRTIVAGLADRFWSEICLIDMAMLDVGGTREGDAGYHFVGVGASYSETLRDRGLPCVSSQALRIHLDGQDEW